jgi:hypothetical protein
MADLIGLLGISALMLAPFALLGFLSRQARAVNGRS